MLKIRGKAIVVAFGLLAGNTASASAKPCRMQGPDVSVSGITLTDKESAVNQVGAGAALVEDADDLPRARFVSKSGVEELNLFAHFDAGPDEYAEAEVRLAGTEALVLDSLPVESFVTGRGVTLGMSPAEVIKRFGKCIMRRDRRGSVETIDYRIEKADKDSELKAFGYPTYYAEYEFHDQRLVRFRFGFESP